MKCFQLKLFLYVRILYIISYRFDWMLLFIGHTLLGVEFLIAFYTILTWNFSITGGPSTGSSLIGLALCLTQLSNLVMEFIQSWILESQWQFPGTPPINIRYCWSPLLHWFHEFEKKLQMEHNWHETHQKFLNIYY
jgi:hypothetical protein